MKDPVVVILIIAAYFLALMLVAHFTSKGADNSTYFTGNRNMAWPLVAVAMITAPISGITFISAPGMVASKGYTYLQMCLGFVVGYLVIAWVLVPLFYKHKIISIYTYLEKRFGNSAYKTGAWLFLMSEVLGVGVRFMVVCVVLQMLVFDPLNLPFTMNVLVTMSLIWLYTLRGGVKSVIWSDTVKSICLLLSIALFFYFIASQLGLSFKEGCEAIRSHHSTVIFNFDNPMEATYFWKQFLTGIFIVVAMTGLDQDMMQRILACKDSKDARKNLSVSGFLQFLVIAFLLALGTLMVIYMESHNLEMPEKTDDLFATVAFHEDMPGVVGILFILGIVSASYSSVGSALTSLTTSFTVDILKANSRHDETGVRKIRNSVHLCMAVLLSGVIIAFYYINNQDAITALFTLASYTYGPILGLFLYGIFSRRRPESYWIPWICILSPVISWVCSYAGRILFDYDTGFELFLLNTAITIAGLTLVPAEQPATETA